jgi:AAA domain
MTPSPARPAPPTVRKMTLGAVSRGRVQAPLRVLAMGVPGVGKSTFAAGAPAPIFLGAEDGTNSLDVSRFPTPTTWTEVLEGVRTLTSEKHEYKTLVIDTLDSLEPLVWKQIIARDGKADGIEQVGGGYGKGYIAACDEWRVLISDLERVRAAGMNVVLLAHCTVVNFKNPIGPDFDRYVMKLDKRAGSAIAEWVDVHLFAQFEGGVKEERGKRPKGWSTETRILHTRRTAAWDAKNRFDLPEELPLSWEDFHAAVRGGRDQDALRARIIDIIGKLPPEHAGPATGALARATDPQKMAQLENWVLSRLPEEK